MEVIVTKPIFFNFARDLYCFLLKLLFRYRELELKQAQAFFWTCTMNSKKAGINFDKLFS